MMTARAAILAAAMMLAACSRGVDPATASEHIVGEWEKLERSMPPVHLLITRHGDGDRVRLRLSGVERIGTVRMNGTRLVLHFAGTADVTGELVSNTQLRLDLDLPGGTRLHKRVP
jgi:hypothetical protein